MNDTMKLHWTQDLAVPSTEFSMPLNKWDRVFMQCLWNPKFPRRVSA